MTDRYPAELFRLDGKCALVTGARQGIGRAIAVALARAGADIVVTSRTGELDATVEEVRAHGRRALAVELDVTRVADIEAAIARAVEAFGRLDVLINNAGVTARAPASDLDEREWNDVVATNLTGTFLVSRAAARGMAETGGGRIINLSSTFARVPTPSRAAYAASKAGVEQLTRVLACEWAPSITVNALAPTTIITDSRADFLSDPVVREARIAEIPMGRLETADDLAGAVLLLAGAAGAFITGQTLVVDGGFSLD